MIEMNSMNTLNFAKIYLVSSLVGVVHLSWDAAVD